MNWAEHGWPLVYAGGLWFVATGAVLALDSGHRARFRASLIVTGILACAAIAAIALTVRDTSAFGAYAAFTAALLVWGWHELAFLTGAATGPRREPLPAGTRGLERFRLSAATLIHHEIGLALTLLILVAIGWNAPNQVAAYSFGLLFAMRLSTKLNIFAGVPHLDTTMLPAHLAYLGSYFRIAPAGLPMALSLSALTASGIWLGSLAVNASGGDAVGLSLLFALVALGLLEHLFLVMPTRDAALWRWANRNKTPNNAYRNAGAGE